MNSSMPENFIRSANEPQIRAGVMIAKVIWKHMNTFSVDGRGQGVHPHPPSRPSSGYGSPAPLKAPMYFCSPASAFVVKASE